MVKEMGEWLMVQGPGIESQWESVALYWCQSVCVVFPVLFSSMVSEGRQDMVKPRLSVNTEQQPQERQQLTVQRSEEVSRVLSQVNGFQVQRAAKALRREYVRCIKRRARKQVCLKRCVAGEGREFGKQAGRRAWGVWEDPLGHYNGFGFYFANENFKQRTDTH